MSTSVKRSKKIHCFSTGHDNGNPIELKITCPDQSEIPGYAPPTGTTTTTDQSSSPNTDPDDSTTAGSDKNDQEGAIENDTSTEDSNGISTPSFLGQHRL